MEQGQTETNKDVDVNPELDDDKKAEVWKLLEEYLDIFSDKPNLTNLGTHEIKLTNTEHIQAKPYPIPHAMRNILSNEIDSMLKLKVIESSISAYASPVVMVKKPDNGVRVCCDYKRLNKLRWEAPQDRAFVTLCSPIAFASRKLLPREQNYATIELECLAVVWGTFKFQKYLYGQHYLLEVDHEPLKYLTQSSYQNGRLTLVLQWIF